MTEIAPVGTATGATSGSVAAQAASEGAETVSDFDDFLTLLTAQLENQDPLSPLDATTFVEQLASFSEVEQAVATNQKLDEIMAQVFNAGLDQAAAWIGRSVQASGLDFQFDGSELTIDVPTEPNATSASVVLRDKDGREVATLPASVDGGEVTWDGTKADGSKAAAGSYEVEFVYGKGAPGTDDFEQVTRKAEGSGIVREVRLENGAPVLILDNGARLSTDEVTSVADPSPSDEAASLVDDVLDEAVDAVTG